MTDLISETEDGDELEIIAKIFELMESDDDWRKQSWRLVELFNTADNTGKMLIDDTLRCLCGLGLATIVRRTTEPQYEGDCYDDDANEAQKECFARDKAEMESWKAALIRTAAI